MPDPLDSNDDWAELARELERDKPPAPPADLVERRAIEEEAVEPHRGAEQEAEGEPEAAADEEYEEEGGAEQPGEGQPGTGRKRRRRRRRRRKGGAGAEGAPALAGDAPGEEAEAAEGEIEVVGAEEVVAEGDDFDAEDVEPEPELVPFGVEEDTATEALRELIANWNVPSWEEIVGSLHRPGQ